MELSGSCIISTDKSLLDIPLIHDYLSNRSYWAQGRSLPMVRQSIEKSLCFGLYVDGKQAGFARVITDYTVFAWLLDVFMLEAYQGQGLGKRLIQHVRHHPDLQGVRRWMLATRDAHGLYQPFGFAALADPAMFMELVNPKPS